MLLNLQSVVARRPVDTPETSLFLRRAGARVLMPNDVYLRRRRVFADEFGVQHLRQAVTPLPELTAAADRQFSTTRSWSTPVQRPAPSVQREVEASRQTRTDVELSSMDWSQHTMYRATATEVAKGESMLTSRFALRRRSSATLVSADGLVSRLFAGSRYFSVLQPLDALGQREVQVSRFSDTELAAVISTITARRMRSRSTSTQFGFLAALSRTVQAPRIALSVLRLVAAPRRTVVAVRSTRSGLLLATVVRRTLVLDRRLTVDLDLKAEVARRLVLNRHLGALVPSVGVEVSKIVVVGWIGDPGDGATSPLGTVIHEVQGGLVVVGTTTTEAALGLIVQPAPRMMDLGELGLVDVYAATEG